MLKSLPPTQGAQIEFELLASACFCSAFAGPGGRELADGGSLCVSLSAFKLIK